MAYMMSEQTDKILEVDKLRKSHPNHEGANQEDFTVIDNVSFDVKEGEFVTIIGPSGCGKSTLLSIIAGLESYDSGDIVVKGHRIGSTGPDIVIIFQEESLFPWLTVQENVEFSLKQKDFSKEERKRIASEYIELVELTAFAQSRVHRALGRHEAASLR